MGKCFHIFLLETTSWINPNCIISPPTNNSENFYRQRSTAFLLFIYFPPIYLILSVPYENRRVFIYRLNNASLRERRITNVCTLLQWKMIESFYFNIYLRSARLGVVKSKPRKSLTAFSVWREQWGLVPKPGWGIIPNLTNSPKLFADLLIGNFLSGSWATLLAKAQAAPGLSSSRKKNLISGL